MRQIGAREYISKGGVVARAVKITPENLYMVANWCGGMVTRVDGTSMIHIPHANNRTGPVLVGYGDFVVRRRADDKDKTKLYPADKFHERFDEVVKV